MTTIDRRDALKLFASVGAAGLLAACGSLEGGAARPAGQVTVGLIVPQAGPNAKIGAEMSAGFQLYLQSQGQKLGGVPVGLNLINEGATPAAALAAVKAGIAAGATVLVGVASAVALDDIRDTVNTARIPLIGTRGVMPSPPFRASDVIWQAGYVVGESGTAMGSYLTAAGHRQLLVFADASDESAAEVTTVSGNFGGTTNVRTAPAVPTTRNIRDALNSFPADVVFAAYTGANAVAFVKAFRATGSEAVLCGPGSLTEGPVLQSMPASAKGILTAMPYGPDVDNAANRAFVSAYTSMTFEGIPAGALPSMYAMAAYDAAYVLDRAVREIDGTVTPGGINQALKAPGRFDSPRGPWSFNQPRGPRQRWYLREVRRDGDVLANLVVQQVGTLS